MKKSVITIIWVSIFLSMFIPDKVRAKSSDVIRVGVFDYEAFYGKNDEGTPYGYGYEYLDTLSKYGGFEYEYVYGSWAECLERLKNGEIDMVDSAQKHEQRQSDFLFSKYSTGTSYGELFVKKNNSHILYNDFEAIDGLTVGVLEKNSRNDMFLEFAQNNAFSVNIVTYKTAEQLSESLQKEEVDAIVSSNLRQGKNERSVARFAPTPFYIMVNSDRPKLKEKIDKTLEEILVESPDFNAQLNQKYYDRANGLLMLTKEEQAYIKNADTIRVVYNDNWKPFASYNDSHRQVEGINVDILELISKKTGLTFEYINELDYESAIHMISKGDADLLLGFENSLKEEERLQVEATDSFISATLCLVGSKLSMPENPIFAVPKNSQEMASFVQEQFPDSSIILFDTSEECYSAVNSEKADFALDNIYAATENIKKWKSGGLHISFTLSLKDYYSFGVSKEKDPILVKILNKGIASISTTEINSIFTNHTINKISKIDFWDFLYHYRRQIISLCLTFSALALCAVIIRQKANKKNLWKTAYIDQFTGIGNMNYFNIEAAKLLRKNEYNCYAIYKFDIESLKLFNEIYGFKRGDDVIRLLAKKVQSLVVKGIDSCARISDDDFIFLKSYPKETNTLILKEDYEKKILNLLMEEFGDFIKLKFGIYRIEDAQEELGTLIERANYAHSICKTNPDIRCFVYDEEVKQSAIEEKLIEDHMKEALSNKEFILYLQPKYYLSDESLAGAEALVRWKNGQDGNIIYPGSFIPLFEKNGFITQLDMYMLEQVCILVDQWIKSGIKPITISINFSRLHLLNPWFTKEICDITDQYNIPREYIEIELTESTMFNNEDVMLCVLDKLHEAGFTLSMDDFGTGYSSLGLLKNLPVDVIKIDRSFFVNNRFKNRAKAVLENVMQMAKQLQIITVAEGIENHEHIELLQRIGCDIVQGFYYARPMPANEFDITNQHVHAIVTIEECSHELKQLESIFSGRKRLGSDCSVYAYRLFQNALRQTLNEYYGDGETIDILRKAGRMAGSAFAKEMLDISCSFEEFMQQVCSKFVQMKICVLEIEQFDTKNGSGIITVSDDLDCSGTPECNKTLCQYEEGFIAGLLKEYTKKNYSVIEVDCWGTGHYHCRFEVRPR